MVFFRGQKKVGPRLDWSPLRVLFKIFDEHPRPFHMGVPPVLFIVAPTYHKKMKETCTEHKI